MKSLGNLLKKREQKMKPVLTDKDIFYVFEKVIREEFGNMGILKLKADFFKNKTVFVKSASSVWGSELFINKKQIIRKMNERLGDDAVKEIKLK